MHVFYYVNYFIIASVTALKIIIIYLCDDRFDANVGLPCTNIHVDTAVAFMISSEEGRDLHAMLRIKNMHHTCCFLLV